MAKYILSILFICSSLSLADPKLDKLVEQLGAASFKDRKAAEQTLWELLPDSEDVIRKAAESDDPEIKIRAQRVLEKYEKGILPGVTEALKLKIEEFWRSSKKSLFIRDWLYSSEFKDVKIIIQIIKLAEKKGESIRISEMLSQRDLFTKLYLLDPHSNSYRFFLRKYAEEGYEEIYLNRVKTEKSAKEEIAYYESHPKVNEEKIKSLLHSLYLIAGNKDKAAEYGKGDQKYELTELIRKKDFQKILAEKKYIQDEKEIGEERSKLLYQRLSGDREKYRLAKQNFINDYASQASKSIHLSSIHALISNGEFEDAKEISLKIEPLWYSRILTLSTDLNKKIEFANNQKDSGSAAYLAFEYSRLFRREDCKKWLAKAKFSGLNDRWLYYYTKAYVYAYGLEEAFDHIADEFSLIQSSDRQQVYFALCPDFYILASYVVGYRKEEVRDNFLILKKFVTKKIEGDELADFYTKTGSSNGQLSEYRSKLVYEAAVYLKDEEKLKSFKDDFLKFDSNKLYLAKKEILLENYQAAAKLLESLNVKDNELLIYLYLKTKCFQGLGDRESFKKNEELLKNAPVSFISLNEDFIECLDDWGDKEIKEHFLSLYHYYPVRSTALLQSLVDHCLAKEDFDQAYYYSIQYYLNRNRSTIYLYPSQSINIYLNFVKVEFSRNLKAGKVAEALKSAGRILAVTPHIYEFHVGIINSLKTAGFTKESEAYYTKYMNHYEKMIDFSAENSTALNDWAWSAALCDRQLELAEKRSRMAVKMEPDSANLLDTLGEVLFRLGKVEEAIKVQTQACEFAGESKFSSFRAKLNRFKNAQKQ